MKGWEVKTLGEICEIARGGSPRPIQDYLTDDPNGINWIKISDATASGKYIFQTAEKIRPEGVKRSRLVKEGDFLLSNSMSFGRPYIMKTAGCIHDGWLVLSRKVANFEPDYLYHFLGSDAAYKQFDSLAAGSTVRNLNIDLAKKVTVPLPRLDEQRRIVAILDEAFAGLAVMRQHAEANLKNARALFDSHLNAVFSQRGEGWVTEGLNEHVRFVDYRGKTPPKRDAGIRLITAKNVKMGFIRREPEEFIDPAAYDEWMTRGFPNKGDVLFTTEAPLGNVAQLDTDEKVVIGQRLITMQPVPNVLDREFLAFMLMSGPLQEAIHAKATGATVLGIKAKLLKFIPISYPPKLAEQRAIADRIEEISLEVARLEALYRQKLAAVDELKQSILHRAFSGQLSAKDALAA